MSHSPPIKRRRRGESVHERNQVRKRGVRTSCRTLRERQVRTKASESAMRVSTFKIRKEGQWQTDVILCGVLLSARCNTGNRKKTYPDQRECEHAYLCHDFRSQIPSFDCRMGPVMGLRSSHCHPTNYRRTYHLIACRILSSRLFFCTSKSM